MLDTLVTLAEQFAGPVRLNVEACLNSKHKGQPCSYCAEACPTEAIKLTNDVFSPVEMDLELCVKCGGCVSACPTGAFSQPTLVDEHRNLMKVINELKGSPVELTCPRHPGTGSSSLPVDSIVDAGKCLASLPLSVLLSLAVALSNDLWINDRLCANCPISRAVEPVRKRVEAANAFLRAWGHSGRIHLASELEPSREHPAEFYDGQQPGYSRREFFSALSRLMLKTMGAIVEEAVPVPIPEPAGSLPQERINLKAVIAGMGEPGIETIDLKGHPFGNLEISDSCSGCNLCVRICPTGALTSEIEEGIFKLNFTEPDCLGCDLCAISCPEKAISVESTLDTETFSRSRPITLIQGRVVHCRKCGAPIIEREGKEPLCYICKLRTEFQVEKDLRGEILEMIEDLKALKDEGKNDHP